MRTLNNNIQFAVVREDPTIEEKIARQYAAKNLLLIGSGGCTLFHLINQIPEIHLTVVEPNPAQIDLIEKKRSQLEVATPDLRLFSVDNKSQESLNNCGNFESLFRQFRLFLYEFVMPENSWVEFFTKNENPEAILTHKYWPVAFDLFFHDSILRSMFGEAAIQHAPKDSYSVYFRSVLERGLRQENKNKNYFLHHIFLGRYLPDCYPDYLKHTLRPASWSYVRGFIQDVKTFSGYDLITLSNIFDWSAEDEVATVANRIATEAKPGCVVMFRQLNNAKSFRNYFKDFDFADTTELVNNDRSLFYSRIEVGVKK